MSLTLPAEVSVLILGGTAHFSCSLIKWLIDPSKDVERPGIKISHVRLADKFIVSNGISNTYIEPGFWAALKDPRVEYRQINLIVPASLSKAYDNPNGNSYDVVFDFTGEGVGQPDLPEELLLERTAKLARSIAAESKRRKVLAHIRDTYAFVKVDSSAPALRESDTIKPRSVRAYWWYEAERAAASVPDLALAITRSAEVVGPFVLSGTLPSRFAMGYMYRHLKEPLKLLWGPELRIHTIHVDDWCRAAWKIVEWLASHSRSEADQIAGELLPPVRISDKRQDTLRESVGAGCCPRSETPTAPVFNLVDDSDFNQGKLVCCIKETFGIEAGFVNALVTAWARFNLSSVAEDLNEKHYKAIAEIVQKTGIQDVALKGWLDAEILACEALALDNTKAKKVLGWTPEMTVGRERLEEILDRLTELNQYPARDP